MKALTLYLSVAGLLISTQAQSMTVVMTQQPTREQQVMLRLKQVPSVTILDFETGKQWLTARITTLKERFQEHFPSFTKKKTLIVAMAVTALCVAAYYGYQAYLQPGATLHDVPLPEDNPVVKILRDQGLSTSDQEDVLSVIGYFQKQEAGVDLRGKLLNPGGILISGPPGTGKTTVAEAIAKAAGCELVEATPEKLSTPSAIHNLFEAAREKAQKICQAIFLDEMDQVSKVGSETLNQLLIETERSVPGNNNLLRLGATNFPDVIAPSAQRSGRFDYHLRVKLPDIAGRIKIFTNLLGSIKHRISPAIIAEASTLTEGMPYTDLANTVRRAALNAAFTKKSDTVDAKTFMDAVYQVARKVHND